jgi:hypothetical protein
MQNNSGRKWIKGKYRNRRFLEQIPTEGTTARRWAFRRSPEVDLKYIPWVEVALMSTHPPPDVSKIFRFLYVTERIKSLMLLLSTALQELTLIEFVFRKKLVKNENKLS